MDSVAAVILAAGMGTRMRSQRIKVLHPILGRPMLEHAIEGVRQAGVSRLVVVVGHQADDVMQSTEAAVTFVVQQEQLGTGHAVMQAEAALADHRGTVLVTCGDTPLFRAETYRSLMEAHADAKAKATALVTTVDDPTGYGRVVRDPASGAFQRVVEERDIASDDIRAIREVNAGVYCFDGPTLFAALRRVKNDNQQGEYYLPDVLRLLAESGANVATHALADPSEGLGINDRRQLAEAERVLRMRVLERLMADGVTIVDPETTFIHSSVAIGQDTTVWPFTIVEGKTRIGSNCVIGPHSRLQDAVVGDGAAVQSSVVVESQVGPGAKVGPYAYLSPGASVAPGERRAGTEGRADNPW